MTTPFGSILTVEGMCAKYLRPVSGWTGSDATGYTATFNPALTTGEQTTYNDIETLVNFGIASTITLAEFQAIKPDLVTARTFLGIASPTAAQSNAALKATIRVIGALLRQ